MFKWSSVSLELLTYWSLLCIPMNLTTDLASQIWYFVFLDINSSLNYLGFSSLPTIKHVLLQAFISLLFICTIQMNYKNSLPSPPFSSLQFLAENPIWNTKKMKAVSDFCAKGKVAYFFQQAFIKCFSQRCSVIR